WLAENLSAVFACVQVISETVGTLPLRVHRVQGDGVRSASTAHPVARLFADEPNSLQTPPEFIETMTAHCLLRGNAYAEIVFDNRGAPIELIPLYPDHVAVLRIPGTRRVVFDYSDPITGGTRRLLADEVLHLKDRSDDGIIGKSRLQRARETFGTAIAVERHAANTFKNGATLSGVLSHPDQIGEDASERLRKSFEDIHKGSGNAGKVAVLEEGLKWQSISVAPEDAELLASRKFGVETIARIYRVPPPVIGDLEHGNYANTVELNRMFAIHCIRPWLTKWERAIERALLSEEGRRTTEVEFDMDELTRGDMLTRWQAYRIMREIGGANANEIRAWEKINRRTDPGGDEFLSPMNMASEQTGRPIADRGGANA
ncbi:MAG TPA: phage portal protein, partial [Pseudolabrys sp.]|nr:phage portal protein [Pseudolabrys sp.]